LLHGFDGDPSQWTRRMRVPEAMDSLVAAGRVREMIVVMPDGRNTLGGSFFANTAAMGRWEDFAAGELVRHVDRRYRTLPRAAGRGVAGWSMGGWSALHLAARRPDVFGAAYALSPCCMGSLLDDVGPSASGWDTTAAVRTVGEASAARFGVRLRLAVAALLTPDAGRPLGVALPFAAGPGGMVPAEPAHTAWRTASPDSLVARHGAGLARLRGLGFDAGSRDDFRHIPASVRTLSAALDRAGIAHAYEPYDGTHGSHVPARIRTRVLPFLSGRLEGQSSRR
ncbi:MAG TPA: alpha/beta hydrolase-fold protein, partial [Longimicrobiaceae bacterium]